MPNNTETLRSFYDRHIDEYGSGAQAVGWNDANSQEIRFRALCETGDLSGKMILDVGCGWGDLYGYLTKYFKDVRYTGIDINPRYIARARELYPEATFEVADFSDYEGRPFDYVFASGAFSFKIPDHKSIYFGHIKKMFELARTGVAFNMLDRDRHPDNETYAAYSAEEVRAFCLTLTPHATIHHNYLPHDFTVWLGH